MKKQSCGLLVIFIGLFFCLGIPILLSAAKAAGQSIDSLSWPTVEGVITSAQITTTTDSKNNILYNPEIVYAYVVNGQTFTSSNISFNVNSFSTSNFSNAEQIVSLYPVGRTVSVHYNPKDYRQAVLAPGFHPLWWIPLAVGAILTLIGALLVYALVRLILNGQISLPWVQSANPPGDK